MSKDLKQLKNQILDDLIKVTDQEGLTPVEKFDFTMTQFVNTGKEDLLSNAYEISKQHPVTDV